MGRRACPSTSGKARWRGGEEIPIHIKTTYARHKAVVQALAQMHPYDVPEIIVLPVIGGAAPYLDWVRQQTAVVQNKRD